MDNRILLIYVIFVTFWDISTSSTVSFFGDSYVHVPAEDASGDTDVRLHFRTHRPDGLLLLAAGETDFCVIELEGGKLLVRIDLGSGEATVRSPPELVFNDLRWHKVQLIRHQAHIELHVDDIYHTSATTPGRFYELNIDHGLFLGSTRNSDIFFGHFVPFRGCLEEVMFNSIDIFHQSEALYSFEPRYRGGITWECSQEFSATSEQPISFLSNTSFIAFPGLNTRFELVRLTFDLRTRTQKCILLYHSGKSYNSDFVVVEIVNGDLKLTINKGSGALEFLSQVYVADGMWHQVEIVIDPINIRLAIDGERKERRTNFGQNRFLDLDGFLYVGGLDVVTRSKAMQYQLPSLAGSNAGAGSVVGCIQNFKINGEIFGFREAEITKDLHPGCLWSFPCSSDPCVEEAECSEEGYYHYQCICELENCFAPESPRDTPSVPMPSMLHVQDIVVREGESALISSNNIELLADYQGHGIADVAVLYRVVSPPVHGALVFSEDKTPQEVDGISFTQDDLINNRVTFVHDDTESAVDSIGFELGFLGSNQNLPSKFHVTYPFSLMIQVAPWNDKPTLNLPPDDTLVIVQNTFVVLTPELMLAEDRDDAPEELEYSVQYQQGYDVGYFEINDVLGVRARIHSFTQADVNGGIVKFVHRGVNTQQFRIQVSDGKDISNPRMLHVNAVPLRLNKKSNTGMDVFSGTVTMLAAVNLTYETNAPNQNIDIRYDVTDPPYYGVLERQQQHTGAWISSTAFTQQDISENRVRYHHNSSMDRPENDYFRYRVHSMDVTTQEFEFFIRVTPVKVDLVRNEELILMGSKEGGITNEHLRGVSTVEGHSNRDVYFSVLDAPEHGDVIMMDGFDKIKIMEGMNFTQRDVDTNKLLYRLKRTPDDAVEDEFQFRLVIPGDVSDVHTFAVKFEPTMEETRFVNNLLIVREGAYGKITRDDLYIETPETRQFKYRVTSFPHHGALQLINPRSGEILNENVTRFTNVDINQERLYYLHDDSETGEDMFEFRALPVSGTATPENTFVDTFEIEVRLQNDNPPIRTVHKVINIVRNHGKLLTLDDIQYHDPDINFNSDNLVYTKDIMENGDLVLASDHSFSLYNFTQSELDLGHVYFKHFGPRYGRSVLRVSDGKFETNGSLEVRASEPYIRILNNTGLTVEKGMSVPISSMNLSLESNLRARDEDVVFEILTTPTHGGIVQTGSGQPRTLFSMRDIRIGKILYQHDGSNHLQDRFHFKARINDSEVEGEVTVRVNLDSGVEIPPSVITNEVLIVDDLHRAAVNRHYLRITHPNTPDNEIIYAITRLPQYGTLVLRGNQGREVSSFSQRDINNRKLYYHHEDAGSNRDYFVFDVTNGDTILEQVEFAIQIVPRMIPLVAHNFTVPEGQRQVINRDILQVTEEHFLSGPLMYVVVKAPSSGWLVDPEHRHLDLIQFTQQQVDNEQIYYMHDGNDTLRDEFSVMVKSVGTLRQGQKHKQSYPVAIFVTVVPENDQAPKVTVNKRLEVWTGSRATLTHDYLQAVDKDSTPSQILFEVTKPTNGELKLVDYLDSSVTNFTQQQINDEKVIFVHTGGMAGEFHFQVSDGVNHDRRRTFVITASRLHLTMYNDRVLEVFPQVLQPIRPDHLFTHTNDEKQNGFIIYSLESRPSHGILVSNKGGSLFEVTSFTQEEINNGTIAYRHYSAMQTPVQYDSFIFQVSAPFAEDLEWKQFDITISYENINTDNLEQLVKMVPVSVEEGGQFSFTRNNLDADKLLRHLYESGLSDPLISFLIDKPPERGNLTIRGVLVTNGTQFSQGDIDSGEVRYVHDHSETLSDVFYYLVQIQFTDTSGRVLKEPAKLSIPFNITILPINDCKYQLQTNHPFVTVVQGGKEIITRNILRTTDCDTTPDELIYNLEDPPEYGHLALEQDLDIPIRRFSQEDIDERRLYYVSDGNPYPDGFYFYVSDGHHERYYKAFNIHIEPLTLKLKHIEDLDIMQGQMSVFLDAGQFEIETNGDVDKVMFNVTRAPKHGNLYDRNQPAYSFSLMDIQNELLNYVQGDLDRPSDSFELTVYDKYNSIYGKTMNIKVKPLVKSSAKEPFEVKPGETATITLAYLNATELAVRSGSIPVYFVTNQPRHGQLVKLIRYRAKRDVDSTGFQARYIRQGISNFTHRDIAENTIQYKANEGKTYKPTTDSFSYTLRAENTQPAAGTFRLTLPATHEPTSAPTMPPTEPVKPKDNPSPTPEVVSTSGVRRDTLTIVIVIVVVSVGIFLLFIIYKCYKRRKSIKRQQFEFEADLEERKALKSRDGRETLAPPNVYTDHYRGQRGGQPMPQNYDPDTMPVGMSPDINEYQRSQSPSEKSITFDPNAKMSPYRSQPHPEPTHTSLDRSDYGSGSAQQSPDLDQMLESRSLDSDTNRGVPTCKVTPMCDSQDSVNNLGKSPDRPDSGKGQPRYDWENMDPELLQHYRKTNPVLHKTKHWV